MTVENARIAILSVSIMQKGRIVLNGFRLRLKNGARKMILLQGKKSNSSVPTFVKLNADLNHPLRHMTAENVKIVLRFDSIIKKTGIALHGFQQNLINDAGAMILLQGKMSDSSVLTFVKQNANWNLTPIQVPFRATGPVLNQVHFPEFI
jgi:hypothetical protein